MTRTFAAPEDIASEGTSNACARSRVIAAKAPGKSPGVRAGTNWSRSPRRAASVCALARERCSCSKSAARSGFTRIANPCELGEGLLEEFETLPREEGADGRTRHVPARARKTRDQSRLHRVPIKRSEDDGDRRRGLLGNAGLPL